jgi:IrrE N-terminal-like domain
MTVRSMSAARLNDALAKRLDAPDARSGLRRACAYLLTSAGQERPPIRLKALLKHLSVDFSYESATAGSEEASLVYRDGRVSLAISPDRFRKRPRRARFSIAHEIGHLLLLQALGHEGLELSEIDEEAYLEGERLCDFVASHLLMPRELLAAAVRERGIGRSAVRSLTDTFDVSREALFRSVAELIPDGAVGEWRNYQRHEREPRTWRVWNWYAPMDSGGTRPWLPNGCTLKHLTVGSLLPQLESDKSLPVSDVEVRLNGARSRHDAVLCLWSRPIWVQQQFSETEEEQGSADCLFTVLGRKDRVDLEMLGIARTRQ